MAKIDVYNRGSRTYTSPSGVHIADGQTTQLDKDEGEALMRGYPADLISPDDLRSVPANQSSKDQHDLIVSLQNRVKELEAENTDLVSRMEKLTLDLRPYLPDSDPNAPGNQPKFEGPAA